MGSGGWLLVSLGAVIAGSLILQALRVVPINQAAVVERLGSYRRTMGPGLHLLLPFVEKVRALVDLAPRRQQQTHEVRSADGHAVPVTVVLASRVVDAPSSVYAVANLDSALWGLVATILDDLAKRHTLAEFVDAPHLIDHETRAALDGVLPAWGVLIERFEAVAGTSRHDASSWPRDAVQSPRDPELPPLPMEPR